MAGRPRHQIGLPPTKAGSKLSEVFDFEPWSDFVERNFRRPVKRALTDEDSDVAASVEGKGAGTTPCSERAFGRGVLAQSPKLSDKEVEALATNDETMI